MNDPTEAELLPMFEREWGPTEPDEFAVLDRLFPYDAVTGTFGFRAGSLIANTAAAVLNQAQETIGVKGRPNVFTHEYAERHGSEFLTAAWCAMKVTYDSRHAPAPALTPHGDRAYTPWFAHDYTALGQSHAGTRANVIKYAMPGTTIFFDWAGTDDEDVVDHIGITVRNLGDGRLVTVEGNTSDSVALRVRGPDVISRVCVPAYAAPAPPPVVHGPAWPYGPGVYMRKGWIHSAGVRKVQARLNKLGYQPRLVEDGDFGTKTQAAVRWFQERDALTVDGIVGPVSWSRLFRT